VNAYRTGFYSHACAVNDAAAALGLRASIDLADQRLELRGGERSFRLHAQFLLGLEGGRQGYSPYASERTIGFIGWLPYFNKRWAIGAGKAPFKEYCRANDLRTPQEWRVPADDMRDFVIKRPDSSFGLGLRGPFASRQAADAAAAYTAGAYCEAFVRGRIIKAFYWNERPACVEILDMPVVMGDGTSTLREVMVRKAGKRPVASEDWTAMEETAVYGGFGLDAVPPKGKAILADFRFSSPLHTESDGNSNRLESIRGSALERQLVDCGRTLWLGIPEERRPGSLFSVDAILDDDDRLWLLEMNCNPICHPDVYPLMLEWLFTSPDAVQGPGPAPRDLPAPPPIPAFADRAAWRVMT
jgi:hypothetical protein